MVEGSTNHSFKKLITSAPIFGTTKLSLIDRKAPKLNNIHNIKKDIGINNFNSERSIGQRISFRLDRNCFFLRSGICINKTVKNSIYKL
jgi:hypothetical protein